MTKKLFYDHPYQVEFSADVLEIDQQGRYWRIVLDQTCFYPEGGGQPADRGWIDGIEVADVQSGERGKIYHYLLKKPNGKGVKGKISWSRRRDFMQQHSGQHIISAALWQEGNYTTLSVHMGEEYTTIEIDAPEIPPLRLQRVEEVANGMIHQNLPIQSISTTSEDVNSFPLRKPCPIEGNIRVVQVGDFDAVVCCGLHLVNTGEIGLVKAVAVERIRGNARITWMIGDRAFHDYRTKDQVVGQLQSLLSTRPDNLVETVERLNQEILAQKRKINELETRLAHRMADDMLAAGERTGSSQRVMVFHIWQQEGDSLVKKVIKQLLASHGLLFCLVNIRGEKLQWAIGCSQDQTLDFKTVKDKVLPLIDGKGGGSFPLWQGMGKDNKKMEDFFAACKALFRNRKD